MLCREGQVTLPEGVEKTVWKKTGIRKGIRNPHG